MSVHDSALSSSRDSLQSNTLVSLMRLLFGAALGIPLGIASASATVGMVISPVIIIFAALRATPKSAEPRIFPRTIRIALATAVIGGVAAILSAVTQGVAISWGSIINLVVVYLVSSSVGIVSGWRISEALSVIIMALSVFALYSSFVDAGDSRANVSLEGLWKYAIGVPVAFCVLAILARVGSRIGTQIIVLFALAAVSLALNYRELGLICGLSGVALLAGWRGGRASVQRILLVAAAIFVAVLAGARAMAAGVFGDEIAQRTVAQLSATNGGGDSLLAASRTETPLSLVAVWARPIFGWGNVSNIDDRTIGQAIDFAGNTGYGSMQYLLNFWVRDNGTISLHSIFFESWVVGGILMAIAVGVLGWICLKTLVGRNASSRLYPLSMVVGMTGIIDLFFSPWSGPKPLLYAFTVVVCVLAEVAKRRDKNSAHLSVHEQELSDRVEPSEVRK